jgi:hypothetical protein
MIKMSIYHGKKRVYYEIKKFILEKIFCTFCKGKSSCACHKDNDFGFLCTRCTKKENDNMNKIDNFFSKIKDEKITKLKISTIINENKGIYISKWKFKINNSEVFYFKDGFVSEEIEHEKKFKDTIYNKYREHLVFKIAKEHKIRLEDICFIDKDSFFNKLIN